MPSLTGETPPAEFHTAGHKPPQLFGEERWRFELESPFGPHPDETGYDTTFAAGVLRVVREGWNEMRATDPDYFLGLTVYGSTVKGRAHSNSDADLKLFFNPDAHGHSAKEIDQAHAINGGLASFIINRLEDAGYNSSFLSYGSVEKIPTNHTRIDDAVELLTRGAAEQGRASVVSVPSHLTSLFHLRLGTGIIRDLRQQVVDGLAASPEGEAVWRSLMWNVRDSEEMRRNAKIYLPNTLKGGIDYFRLKSTAIVRQSDIHSSTDIFHYRLAIPELPESPESEEVAGLKERVRRAFVRRGRQA